MKKLKNILLQLNYNKRKHKKRLHQFLKKFDKLYIPDSIAYVKKAEHKTWEKVSCTTCGNCCIKMTPTYTKEDIIRISSHFGISSSQFIKKWLKKSEGDYVNIHLPCQFLDEHKLCSIYDIRPFDCAAFPHLSRQPFEDNNSMFAENLNYCPATMEFLKNIEKAITSNYVL